MGGVFMEYTLAINFVPIIGAVDVKGVQAEIISATPTYSIYFVNHTDKPLFCVKYKLANIVF